jgi:uncharacterized membrane protein YhdT
VTGFRERARRTLSGWLPSLSAKRREWVRAALAELPEVPDRRVLGWTFGIGAIALGDIAEQAFLPWRRDKEGRVPARFAAWLGLACLAAPLYFVAILIVAPGLDHGPPERIASVAGIALCLWLNLAALLKADSLGGLLYAVGLRLLPLNLAAVALAGLLVVLVWNAPF